LKIINEVGSQQPIDLNRFPCLLFRDRTAESRNSKKMGAAILAFSPAKG
jgi:hypothetical protein